MHSIYNVVVLYTSFYERGDLPFQIDHLGVQNAGKACIFDPSNEEPYLSRGLSHPAEEQMHAALQWLRARPVREP